MLRELSGVALRVSGDEAGGRLFVRRAGRRRTESVPLGMRLAGRRFWMSASSMGPTADSHHGSALSSESGVSRPHSKGSNNSADARPARL